MASAGDPLSPAQLRRVQPAPGEPATLDTRSLEGDGLLVLALAAAGRPVGLLVLSGDLPVHHEREPLLLFANHIALAIERVQLRDQALQARLAEEVARPPGQDAGRRRLSRPSDALEPHQSVVVHSRRPEAGN